MGLSVELGIDSEGNKYLSFEDDSSYNNINQIGTNLNDFEILQILSGDKDLNFVAKVRSTKNNKTYSLKKIDLQGISNLHYQLAISIMNQLVMLENPHIIKYYGYFQENNVLYLVMEYMDNSDIIGYIQAHQEFGKQIKEVEIWNILLVCLSAMNYIFSYNLGKNGVKLTNVFMNNKQNIKIGVFRDLFFNSNEYDSNKEILLLGKYCYIMMNSLNIECELLSDKNYISSLNNINVNNTYYSPNLKEIVNNMLEENNINVQDLFTKAKNYYADIYNKTTSIKAILKCLYSYNKLNEKLYKKKSIFQSNITKYTMNNLYINAIESFNSNNENNLKAILDDYKREMACFFFKLEGNKEIDPLLFLTFILDKMHKETNKVDLNKIKRDENDNFNYVKCSAYDGDEEDRGNKMQMLNKFVTYFNSTMSSTISDLFFGFIKTKRICQTCKFGYYFFSNYLYIVFDLTQRNSNENFDLINDGFNKDYNDKEFFPVENKNQIFCDKCIAYQKFVEFNRYYMLNSQLIICFIRGDNCKNKSNIIFSQMINLKEHVEKDISSPHNFYLVGCVKRIYKNNFEEYIGYSRYDNNFSINNITQNNNDEQIMMLFYNSDDKI